jgi:hypothetical protein
MVVEQRDARRSKKNASTPEEEFMKIFCGLACVLQELQATNDKTHKFDQDDVFSSLKVPAMSIPDYFSRLQQYLHFPPAVYVCALVYVDRLLLQSLAESGFPKVTVNRFTIHRLILVGVTLSAKMLLDATYPNSFLAKVGGIPLSCVNKMEAVLLARMSYDAFVQKEEYEAYLHELLMHPRVCGKAPCGAFRAEAPQADERQKHEEMQPPLHHGDDSSSQCTSSGSATSTAHVDHRISTRSPKTDILAQIMTETATAPSVTQPSSISSSLSTAYIAPKNTFADGDINATVTHATTTIQIASKANTTNPVYKTAATVAKPLQSLIEGKLDVLGSPPRKKRPRPVASTCGIALFDGWPPFSRPCLLKRSASAPMAAA